MKDFAPSFLGKLNPPILLPGHIDNYHSYCHGAHGALIVYDSSNQSTYASAKRLLNEIRSSANSDVVIMLVGNKSDLEDWPAIPTEQANAFAGIYEQFPALQRR